MVAIAILLPTIILSILLHELGHYAAARATRSTVTEFCIGEGPRIAQWGGKTTRVTIRALPLGGRCMVDTTSTTPRRMVLVALAGPAANALVCIAAFAVIEVSNNPADWYLAPFRGTYHFAVYLNNLIGYAAGVYDPTASAGVVGTSGVRQAFAAVVLVNLFLCLYNLLPLYPMDGYLVGAALRHKDMGQKGAEYKPSPTYARVSYALVTGITVLGVWLIVMA